MYKTAQQILSEMDRVLRGVDETQVEQICSTPSLAANLVTVYAMGREGLVMKSFAMRLMHVGVNVAVVGDMTTPPSGPGDLFLVCCGPGHISTVIALVGVAQAGWSEGAADHGAAAGRVGQTRRSVAGAAGADHGRKGRQQFRAGDGFGL